MMCMRIPLVALLVFELNVTPAESQSRTAKGKQYPFAVAPHKAFAIVAELESVSGKNFALAPLVTELFDAVVAGKSSTRSFADLVLIASGITEASAREKFLKQLDAVEAPA